jgi:hypothetical protein
VPLNCQVELVQEIQLPAQRRRSSLPQAGRSVGEEITWHLDHQATRLFRRCIARVAPQGRPESPVCPLCPYTSFKNYATPPAFVLPREYDGTMDSLSRDFIRSTTRDLDRLLTTLTEEEQHDLLDALAAKIEERMDALLLSDRKPSPPLVLED